jgi:hypothetical protein
VRLAELSASPCSKIEEGLVLDEDNKEEDLVDVAPRLG